MTGDSGQGELGKTLEGHDSSLGCGHTPSGSQPDQAGLAGGQDMPVEWRLGSVPCLWLAPDKSNVMAVPSCQPLVAKPLLDSQFGETRFVGGLEFGGAYLGNKGSWA